MRNPPSIVTSLWRMLSVPGVLPLLSWRIRIFPRECRRPPPFFWDAELSLRYVFWHVELVSLRE
jgi:hypothetical protein